MKRAVTLLSQLFCKGAILKQTNTVHLKLKLYISFLFVIFYGLAYSQTNIAINNEILENYYKGNGVQLGPYENQDISEESWQRIFKRLDYMNLSFVRIMMSAENYCISYPLDGTPVYNWTGPKMNRLCRILDYCQNKNVTVILGDWGDPDSGWQNLSTQGIEETDPRWSTIVVDFLKYLLQTKNYTCIKYYNLGNEPNGSWSSFSSFDTWKQAIVNLNNELVNENLSDKITIVGPDAAWGDDWITKIYQDSVLKNIIGAYEVHRYATKSEIEDATFEIDMKNYRNLINTNDHPEKKFFIGEAGMLEGKNDSDQQILIGTFQYGLWMFDFIIQSMRAGQTGLIAWDLDDAMYCSQCAGTITQKTWKKWGFFDSFGVEKRVPVDTLLRPWFYTWSLMSRYIPAGSKTLKVNYDNIPGLRATASRVDSVGFTRMTIALVNESSTNRQLLIKCPFLEPLSFDYYLYNESSIASNIDINGFPTRNSSLQNVNLNTGLVINLPAKSGILLTSLKQKATQMNNTTEVADFDSVTPAYDAWGGVTGSIAVPPTNPIGNAYLVNVPANNNGGGFWITTTFSKNQFKQLKFKVQSTVLNTIIIQFEKDSKTYTLGGGYDKRYHYTNIGNWQEFTIDLTDIDASSRLVILPNPWLNLPAFTLYIDDIIFSNPINIGMNTSVVANFDNIVPLHQSCGSLTSSLSKPPVDATGNAYLVNVPANNSGDGIWLTCNFNKNQYNQLRFNIQSTRNSFPFLVQLEGPSGITLTDKWFSYTGNGEWQQFSINLSDIPSSNKLVILPAPWSTFPSFSFYLDDVGFYIPSPIVSYSNSSTGIRDKLISNKINVYPNPVTDVLNVKIENVGEYANVKLFTIDGKLIYNKYIFNDLEQINLKKLNVSGLLIVNITTAISNETYKIVVE